MTDAHFVSTVVQRFERDGAQYRQAITELAGGEARPGHMVDAAMNTIDSKGSAEPYDLRRAPVTSAEIDALVAATGGLSGADLRAHAMAFRQASRARTDRAYISRWYSQSVSVASSIVFA